MKRETQLKIFKKLEKLGWKKCYWPGCKSDRFPQQPGCYLHTHDARQPRPTPIFTYKHIIAGYKYSQKQENTGWWLKKLKQKHVKSTDWPCDNCDERRTICRSYYTWSPVERTQKLKTRLKRKTRRLHRKIKKPLRSLKKSRITMNSADPKNPALGTEIYTGKHIHHVGLYPFSRPRIRRFKEKRLSATAQ